MPGHIIVAVAGPVEGREAEFHEWYETVHVPEVLALPRFVRAVRYAPGDSLEGLTPGPSGHMTIFEVEAPDAEQALDVLAAALPSLTMSEAVDLDTAHVRAYESVGSW
jgi:hypothetical protein